MPTLITRVEALARIEAETRRPECMMCAIRSRAAGPVRTIYEDAEQLVILPNYVRRWGHVLIMPKAHVTDYSSIDPELWARTCRLAHRAARVVEQARRPRRCYVASIGSSAGELLQTSAHLHIHVIPIYEPDDRPSAVFTWRDGVYVGEPREWSQLLASYREHWEVCA